MADQKKGKRKTGRKPGTGSMLKLPKGQVNPREGHLLENRLLKGMTLADSAKAAGYKVSSQESAKSLAHRVVRRHTGPGSELAEELRVIGIDLSSIAQIIKDGLAATSAVKSGSRIVQVPDHNLRHKFVETVLDIYGARSSKKIDVTQVSFEERILQIERGEV